MQYIFNFFVTNYLTIVTLAAFSFLVIFEMKKSESEHNWAMNVLILVILLMIVADYVDTVITNMDVNLHSGETYYYIIRFIASAVGYAARPIMLMCTIVLLYKTKIKQNIILSIPAVIAIVCTLLSFYNGFLFKISASNIWYPGKGRVLYISCLAFYFLLMVVFLIVKWKTMLHKQRTAILFILISITGSALIDIHGLLKNNILPLAIVISFFFFYLYNYSDRKRKEIDLKTKELEVQEAALKASQIRPHFIYNTLNTIYSLCYENPELAGETTLNFSSYLRGTIDLSKSGNTIPIEEEIQHTQFYTNIEKTRFPDINVEYLINDFGYEVPFLVIQPMVENAIRHGIRGLENGKVTVDLHKDTVNGKKVHMIIISDNGNGESRSNTALGEHKGIGISNVRSRIEKISNGSFDIQMTPAGTTVTMTIPNRSE